jgi:hypothetical protein
LSSDIGDKSEERESDRGELHRDSTNDAVISSNTERGKR